MRFCKGCQKDFIPPKGWTRRRCPFCPDGRWQFIPYEQLKKDKSRRQRLVKERGHRCEVCKNETHCDLPIPLELDHIDGNPENNSKENNRLICPNCHALTPTYKGKNVGKVKNSKRQQVMKRHVGKYR